MPISVIFIDDEQETLQIASKYLKSDPELSVEFTDDIEIVVQRVTDGKVEIVVSDFEMPKMDGLELLQAVRKIRPNIPFIIFTGKSREEIVIRALNMGATNYVEKKGSPSAVYTEIIHLIKNAVAYARAEEERALAEESIKESEEKYRTLVDESLQGILVLVGDTVAYVNPAYARIVDRPVHDIIRLRGEEMWGLVHPDDREPVRNREVRRSKGEALSDEFEYRLLRPDGSVRHVLGFSSRIQLKGQIALQVLVIDVTDQKMMETKLRANEKRYRTLIETMHQGVAIISTNPLRIVYANPALSVITSYSNSEILALDSSSVFEIIHKDDRENVRRIIEMRSSGKGTPDIYQVRAYKKSGELVWLRISSSRIDYNSVPGILVVFDDITAQKKREIDLQESEMKFKVLYEKLPVPYQSLDEGGYFIDVNPAWLEKLGYDRGEVIGKHFSEFLTEKSQKNFATLFPQFICNRTTPPGGVFHEMIKKGGEMILARFTGKVGITPDGAFHKTHCVFTDITEQKAIEDALRKSEMTYRSMFENAVVGLGRSTLDGRLVDCNLRFAKIFGYESAEHAISSGSAFEHYQDPNIRREIIENLQVHGIVERIEKFNKLDGDEIWCHFMVRLFSEEGYIEVACIDVTEQMLMEEELRRNEERFRAIADYTYDWESWFGTDGRLLWVNPAVERMTGYSTFECMNMERYPLCFVHEDEQDMIQSIISDYSRSNTGNDQPFRIITKNGRTKWLAISWQPIYDDAGSNLGIRTSVRDIEDRVQAMRELEAQRKELSEFAHQMKHDISSRLTNILGYVTLLRESCGDESIDKIEELVRMTERLLIQSTKLADAGRIIGGTEPVDLTSVVTRVASVEVPDSVRCEIDPLPTIDCDESKFEQLVQNLLHNAMEHGRPSVIKVRHEEDSEGTHIIFSNDGNKIPEDIRHQLFKEMISSKHGGGFGLMVVAKIAEAHGWSVGLDECEMTSFRITIPP